MKVKTDYFGTVEYEKEDLVTIQNGLFGFAELKYYLPLYFEPRDDRMVLWQSVEDENIAFLTLNPFYLDPDYSPRLKPEEAADLGVEDTSELAYSVISVIHSDYLKNTVNMKCPIVVNPRTRKGMQVILEDCSYDYKTALSQFASVCGSAERQRQE